MSANFYLSSHANNHLHPRAALVAARQEDYKHATEQELAFLEIWSASGTLTSLSLSPRRLPTSNRMCSDAEDVQAIEPPSTSLIDRDRLLSKVLLEEQLLRNGT